MSNVSLSESCRRIAAQLLKKNHWLLVSAEDTEFVAAIEAQLRQRWDVATLSAHPDLDKRIERTVKNIYCRVLYEAFQSADSKRQAEALLEVKQFVCHGLLRMTEGDEQLADECAQDAVTQAWLKHQTVRDPGTFLYFVLQIGIRNVLERGRQNKHFSDWPEDDQVNDQASMFAGKSEAIRGSSEDWISRLREAILNCLPRAIEADVIIGIFLEDRTYADLAKTWGVSTQRLHTIKFRALDKLADCNALKVLWDDWQG